MKPMTAVKAIASWAGLQLSEAGCFALGLGFALEIKDGIITDALPEQSVIRWLAKNLGLKLEEFSTVARSKAHTYLTQTLSRGVPVAIQSQEGVILAQALEGSKVLIAGSEPQEVELLLDSLFQGQGPVKVHVFHYKKTKHIPPLELAGKKALSEIARRFLFPKKPFRGVKAARFAGPEPRWGHEPGLGHVLLSEFLRQTGRSELAARLQQAGQLWAKPEGQQLDSLIELTGQVMRELL